MSPDNRELENREAQRGAGKAGDDERCEGNRGGSLWSISESVAAVCVDDNASLPISCSS